MKDSRIKAVLFDLVGTLIYVKDSVGTVYSEVARGFGFNADPEKLNKSFQIAFHLEAQPTGGEEEEKKWWHRVVLETFKRANYDLNDKFDLLFDLIFKEFTKKNTWAIYSDVIPTLEKLFGFQIGLISNFDSRLEIILKELDLIKYFQVLSYSGKVGYSKPHPAMFQYALSELNVLAEESLYIGDSLNVDYYPACDLNINSLLIDRDGFNTDKTVKSISNLNEIFEFL